MNRWTWKDPDAEPPPLRTRIRIRLSDEFRKRHRIETTCVDGYIHRPGDLPMYGFSVTPGPHVTGWMPVVPRVQPDAKPEPEGAIEASLERLGSSIAEKAPSPPRHWQDRDQ